MEVVCINDDYNEDEGNIAVGPGSRGEEQVGGARSRARFPLCKIYYLVSSWGVLYRFKH